jgi:hypothetical protein
LQKHTAYMARCLRLTGFAMANSFFFNTEPVEFSREEKI